MFGRKRREAAKAASGQAAVPPTPVARPTMDPDAAREALRRARIGTHRRWTPPPPGTVAPALADLGPVLRAFGADAAADAVERGAAASGDPSALFHAGYQLIDVGLDDLATAPLAAALALRPNDLQTVAELAVALEATGEHAEAVALFDGNRWALDASEELRGLYCHDAAMAGDLEAVRAMLPTVGAEGQSGYFAAIAAQRLARYDALAPTGRPSAGDLRGWELVLHGTLVLSLSDHGDEMGGRYAAVWESRESFADRLTLLQQTLAELGRVPTAVRHAPDRDSEILAWAVAARLGTPEPVSLAAQEPPPGSLIVAFQWSAADQNEMLRFAQTPGVTLFGYQLDWTDAKQPAPDTVAVEAQMLVPPWGEQMRVSGTPGSPDSTVETIAADSRAAREVGEEAAAGGSTAATAAEFDDVRRLLAALRGADAPLGLTGGPRHRFYPGGPVGSTSFF